MNALGVEAVPGCSRLRPRHSNFCNATTRKHSNHNNLNNKDIKTSIDSDADRLKGDSKLNVYTDTEISPAKKKSSFQVVQEINLPYYLQEFDV